MTAPAERIAAPRLERLLRRTRAAAPAPPPVRCDLCAEPLAAAHRHLLELHTRTLRCACRACALLFDRPATETDAHRLVPQRLWWLGDLALGEADWARIGIPVGTAFVTWRGATGDAVAAYPSPLGLAESRLDADAAARLRTAHPALATIAPDVEALLVHRRPDFAGHWIASVETCFRLVACVRSHWRGVGGGDDVWRALAAFFDGLRHEAVPARRGAPGPEPGAAQTGAGAQEDRSCRGPRRPGTSAWAAAR